MGREYIDGALGERKAVSRYLTVRAARAAHRWGDLPWWNFIGRARGKWTCVMFAITAAEVERGEHLGEQAKWVADIDNGEAIRRGIDATLAAITAQGIEARQGQDAKRLDPQDESPVAESDAP